MNGAIANKSNDLHLVAKNKSKKIVDSLFKKCANVEASNKKIENPLHIATKIENVVVLFLSKGTNDDIPIGDRLAAFQIFVKTNGINIVELLKQENVKVKIQSIMGNDPCDAARKTFLGKLLSNGADPNSINIKNQSAFNESFVKCNIPLLKLFLSYDFNVKLENWWGEKAMDLLSRCSTKEIEKVLLKINVICNEVTDGGSNPLHAMFNPSRYEKSLLSLNLTINHGRDTGKNSKCGKTALFVAVENEIFQPINYHLSLDRSIECKITENGNTPLIEAIENCNYELVAYLVRSGANVNVKNAKEVSPLHAAIKSLGNIKLRCKIVKLLLGFGANIDDRDSEGSTALHWAIEKGEISLILLLIENGACIYLRDIYFRSPIYLAVGANLLKVVEVLLKMGANANESDINRESILTEAVNQNNVAMVKLLLAHNANPREDKPVLIAAERGNVNIMRLLVSAGADVNTVDFSGFSILVNAIIKSQKTMVEYLLENGADVNFEDYKTLPLKSAFFNFCTLRNRTCKHILRLLLKHIALLSFQNLYVHELNLRLIRATKIMFYRYDLCCRELERMKSTFVCPELPVTYFDLLVKRQSALAKCLRCADVKVAFMTGAWKKLFFNYSQQLEQNFHRGLSRLYRVDTFHRHLNEIFKFVLPNEITYKITEYLSDSDIEHTFLNDDKKTF